VTDQPLGRAATSRLLEHYGIRLRRRLGQHFLVDPNTVRRIVAVAEIGPGERVLEIGAGAGTLTRGLAAAGATVTAYEIDRRLRPVLEEALAGVEGITVCYADATAPSPEVLAGDATVVVANLPYQVGTPLLLSLLRRAAGVERFVVMLQREAVERLAAGPGTKTYGLPSVVAQLHGDVTLAFRVPATVFFPEPPVESAVALIRRRTADPRAGRAVALAGIAFAQRRKMLRRSLGTVLDDAEGVLVAAGIDPTLRAEDLPPTDYLQIAEAADAR
jgi:16S rRNA (adenine1518-N6/adenine1519-N6)-dimethyltransferase